MEIEQVLFLRRINFLETMMHFKYIDKTEGNIMNSTWVATTQLEQILTFCPQTQSEEKSSLF